MKLCKRDDEVYSKMFAPDAGGSIPILGVDIISDDIQETRIKSERLEIHERY